MIFFLACDIKVISTDCPYGPREILDHGKYGTLVETGNVEKLACAIIENIVSNTKKSHQIVFDKYELESVFQSYEKLVNDEKKKC